MEFFADADARRRQGARCVGHEAAAVSPKTWPRSRSPRKVPRRSHRRTDLGEARPRRARDGATQQLSANRPRRSSRGSRVGRGRLIKVGARGLCRVMRSRMPGGCLSGRSSKPRAGAAAVHSGPLKDESSRVERSVHSSRDGRGVVSGRARWRHAFRARRSTSKELAGVASRPEARSASGAALGGTKRAAYQVRRRRNSSKVFRVSPTPRSHSFPRGGTVLRPPSDILVLGASIEALRAPLIAYFESHDDMTVANPAGRCRRQPEQGRADPRTPRSPADRAPGRRACADRDSSDGASDSLAE